MTHFSKYNRHKPIEWEDTFIKRYDSNNGIVLKQAGPGQQNEVIAYINGADIGVDVEDLSDLPITRAEPIFRAILCAYNRAYSAGYTQGYHEAQHKMREALGYE